jgi:hypothetical protein
MKVDEVSRVLKIHGVDVEPTLDAFKDFSAAQFSSTTVQELPSVDTDGINKKTYDGPR